MGHYTAEILDNAEKIKQLHARIHETFALRDRNEHKRRDWQNACSDFHAQYDALAFPGGLDGASDRILSGDLKAMEAVVCFLECRPYFFRSGYMFKAFLRKAKRAPLATDQRERLDRVVAAYAEYRQSRKPHVAR